jgi:multidrug resistance efflux pump
MSRWLVCAGAIAALTTSALAADQLPKEQSDDDSFEVEPPLLIPYRPTEPIREQAAPESVAPKLDPDRLEKALERAKRAAAGAPRLFKMGVISKVEVEKAALRVTRVQCDLENARLLRLKENIALQEKQVASGETSKTELAQTEAGLVQALQAVREAEAKRADAELEAAENNVRRQRFLVTLGIGRKAEVARAEAKVTELKAAKN